MDNFLGLVAKWKHVLTLDRKDSNPELYWQLEDSFLTTEEAFVVAHYENLYHTARTDQKYQSPLCANMAYIFENYILVETFWCKNWIDMCTILGIGLFLLQ